MRDLGIIPGSFALNQLIKIIYYYRRKSQVTVLAWDFLFIVFLYSIWVINIRKKLFLKITLYKGGENEKIC